MIWIIAAIAILVLFGNKSAPAPNSTPTTYLPAQSGVELSGVEEVEVPVPGGIEGIQPVAITPVNTLPGAPLLPGGGATGGGAGGGSGSGSGSGGGGTYGGGSSKKGSGTTL